MENLNNSNIMSKIKLISEEEIEYSSRNGKKAIVVLELEWSSNSLRTGYIAKIKDYRRVFKSYQVANPNDPEGAPITKTTFVDELIPGNTEPIPMTNAQAETLFSQVEPMLPPNLTYAERETELLRLGFWAYVNNDFLEDPNQPGTLMENVTIYKLAKGKWNILRD